VSKVEMGTWIAECARAHTPPTPLCAAWRTRRRAPSRTDLEDAGYTEWDRHRAPLYKAMLMGAFPPLKQLDGTMADWNGMTEEAYEEATIKSLAAMDLHLGVAERQIGRGPVGVHQLQNMMKL